VARLHEQRGKAVLSSRGFAIPAGEIAASPEEAERIARQIGCPVVVKGLAFTTGRAAQGLVRFADTPEDARAAAGSILGRTVRDFPIEGVLVEEKIDVERELYAGMIVDDASRRPVMIVSSRGGSGIEEIAREHPDAVAREPVDPVEGLPGYRARDLVRRVGIRGKLEVGLARALVRLFEAARAVEARSAEVNPLVLARDGRLVAADCRITVDDYAVFRHGELGIDFARELDRPPSPLDRVAYAVEADDYRGTFYFFQLETGFARGTGLVGFHGAGGGGSMMSMDALLARGFRPANFCDTSGNPPASKVYRAARIILAQGPIDAYFGSGSGVASQEQFHSARGLVKAFREAQLSIPAVIRLGGNSEDLAVKILSEYTRDLPATVEGYRKDDSADFCAERLRALVDGGPPGPGAATAGPDPAVPAGPVRPPASRPYRFDTLTGSVTLDHALCAECESKVCVETCVPQILKIEDGLPVLAIEREEAARGTCSECLACEVECLFHGKGGGVVDLPIPGLGRATATREEDRDVDSG
jgi:succinyl-CoA synthetase beta subunit